MRSVVISQARYPLPTTESELRDPFITSEKTEALNGSEGMNHYSSNKTLIRSLPVAAPVFTLGELCS
ncbi:hypothetical protein V22_33190 [Calycomorphotria hydatis]|uniref:Uncharacterized protein n=1 Tax=Calycomorphotria hydatis TaxID=2528027 RepID=A0A517TCE6_9PLAN|nr:hypothetical protein V22_33190 [Calycomorphotria hydatis]